jgi:ABC-type branched-subunit amino acid transport system ATPase component
VERGRSGDLVNFVVEVTDARVGFSGVVAVDGVTFGVERGVTTALIGPNGAGKTTLLNFMCGLQTGSGRVELDGVDVSGWRADRRSRAGMARSFQTPILAEGLDVLSNIRVGRGGSRNRARAEVAELLNMLQVDVPLDAGVAELTHRDRRFVEIARALYRPGCLLLLDEPAAGLSESEQQVLRRSVDAVTRKAGKTTVIIEHNMDLVTSWAADVVVLDRGRVLTRGTPAAVYSDPAVITAYVGAEDAA